MSGRPIHTIGVIGVRDYKGSLYTNSEYVIRVLEAHLRLHGRTPDSVQVVTGGGGGVERMVVDWCKAKSIDCRKIPPNIQEFGNKKAFSVRNNHIVAEADEVVLFWDGVIDIPAESIITAMHIRKMVTVYPVQ